MRGILLLLCLIAASWAIQIPLSRTPHVMLDVEDPEVYMRNIDSRKRGNTVPMGGGVLTMGGYYATITIGDPAVTFNLIVDTGSSNTIVPAQGCKTCGKAQQFIPSKSSSYNPVPCAAYECKICNPDGDTQTCVFGQSYCAAGTTHCGFGVSYGGGSSLFQGFWATDTVCLGGYCANATFGMGTAEYPPMSFSGGPVDGIMGIASPFNACNPTCVPTLLDSLIGANPGLNNSYGMCITPSSGGMLDLGEIVPSRFSGSLMWAPQEVDRWFNIILLDILVGTTSIGLPPFAYATTNDVIGSFVDSGTSIILVAPLIFQYLQNVFQSYYSTLPGISGNATLFDGECFNSSVIEPYLNSYPNLVFVIQGKNGDTFSLPLPASSYIPDFNGVYCLGIQGIPSLGVILGDLFMQNYYIVFDRANQQLGFAPVASCA